VHDVQGWRVSAVSPGPADVLEPSCASPRLITGAVGRQWPMAN